jgi:hypothetical protein
MKPPSLQKLRPWHDPTEAAWSAFADLCLDRGDLEEQLFALRYAVALRLRPGLILVGHLRDGPDVLSAFYGRGHDDESFDWCRARGLRWFTPTGLVRFVVQKEKERARRFSVLTTPLDHEGMTDDAGFRNTILRKFYWKAAYDVRLYRADDGALWYMQGEKPPRRVFG